VRDNVAFGLRARKVARESIERRVQACLRLVGMADYAQRYPRELSGGQQQRVAIARALAVEPQVLLLDEPLSALDAQIRRNLAEEIARLHRELPGLTVLYVTHDQTEAITLADRIAVLKDGRLSSVGPSRELYRRPPNRFTAEFLGRANLLPVTPDGGPAPEGYARVRFGETRILVSGAAAAIDGEDLLVCVRPHDLRPAQGEPHVNRLAGVVRAVHWQGDSHAVTLACSGVDIRLVAMPMRLPPQPGDPLEVAFEPDDATLLRGDGGHG
jgi:2-aminoethylphosphonate transport system ATP-binding protein